MDYIVRIDKRLNELSILQPGWLDGEGKRIKQSLLDWASPLLHELYLMLHIKDFDNGIYPLEDGNIQIEWWNGDFCHSIEFKFWFGIKEHVIKVISYFYVLMRCLQIIGL